MTYVVAGIEVPDCYKIDVAKALAGYLVAHLNGRS